MIDLNDIKSAKQNLGIVFLSDQLVNNSEPVQPSNADRLKTVA